MKDKLSPDTERTRSPLTHSIAGSGNTAEPQDKIESAMQRFFVHIENQQRDYQLADAKRTSIGEQLKSLRIKPGIPLPFEDIPLKRDLIEKVTNVLQQRKLKVKEFRREMGYFDEAEMTRDRAVLEAAGVTVEVGEGSAVYISLSDEFAKGAEEATA